MQTGSQVDKDVQRQDDNAQQPYVSDVLRTWTSGGKYIGTKSSAAYEVACTHDSAATNEQSCFGGDTYYPGIAINKNFPALGQPCNTAFDRAFTIGSEWLYTNPCSTQVISKATDDASWGAKGAAAECTSCTDSAKFTGLDGPVVASVVYSESNWAVATVAYYVTAQGVAAASSPNTSNSVVTFGTKHTQLQNTVSSYNVLGAYNTDGTTGARVLNGVNSITSESNIVCQPLSYTLGRGNTSVDISSTLPPAMQGCTAPAQTTTCDHSDVKDCDDTSGTGLTNSNCCCRTGVFCGCCANTTLQHWEGINVPLLYRRTDTYFAVLVGGGGEGDTVCEFASASSSSKSGNDTAPVACPMLNGVVRPLPAGNESKSVFAFEPNPFRDSTAYSACNKRDLSCMTGMIYAVPVTYSLLNPYFLTPAKAMSTYLAQLLTSGCMQAGGGGEGSGGGGQVCTTTKGSTGYKVLVAMLQDLNSTLPPGTDPVYDGFAAGYSAYAALQVYLLSVCGYTANFAGNDLVSSYPLFQGALEWASTAALFASMYPSSSSAGGEQAGMTALALAAVFGPDKAGLCSDARPLIGVFTGTDTDEGTIDVTLTVPAILLPTLLKDGTGIDASVLANLLLQMFPESATVSGANYVPSVYYQADGTKASQAIFDNKPLATGTSPFHVSKVTPLTAFTLQQPTPVPPVPPPPTPSWVVVQSEYPLSASTPPNTPTILLAVRFTCTLAITVKQSCLTLLFYLNYIQQSQGKSQSFLPPKASMFADSTAAASFQLAPAAVDWAAACTILQDKVCTSDGNTVQYVGNGADLVNALFLNPTSSVCLCLDGANLPAIERFSPASGPALQLNVAAMCFNRACRSPPIVLDSLLTNAGIGTSSGACPDCSSSSGSGSLPGCSGAAYDCTPHCAEYQNVLRNYADVMDDLSEVDWGALQSMCGISPSSIFPPLPSPVAKYYAGLGMLVAAAPLTYGAAALSCWLAAGQVAKRAAEPEAATTNRIVSEGTTSKQNIQKHARALFRGSIVLRKKCFIPFVVVAVVIAAIVVFVLVDFRGKQTCTGTMPQATSSPFATPLDYAYPTSRCELQSSAVSALAGPSFRLSMPQEFCTDAPQSYCEYANETSAGGQGGQGGQAGGGGGESDESDTTCLQTSSQMCQQHGADGLCTASANEATVVGREVKITQRSSQWSFSTLCLCSGLAVALVPAAGFFSWFVLRIKTTARVWLVGFICAFVLGLCFVYAIVQYYCGAKTVVVGYGRCASLATFPDTLVPMLLPATALDSYALCNSSSALCASSAADGPGNATFVVDTAAAFLNGGPVYKSTTNPIYYCYCAKGSSYGSTDETASFVLTDTPPPSSQPTSSSSFFAAPQATPPTVHVMYVNDSTSPPLLDVSSAAFSGTVLYSGFQVPPGASYVPDVAFCGKLGNKGSSCGTDASVCACAPTNGQHMPQ